jgi:hypothetical protein
MLLESLQYSDVSSFLRARDNREAIASYILDEGEQLSFFDKFPGLVYKEFRLDEMVGDLIKLRFYNVTRGVGLAGPYKPTRQLTGSESMSRSAYREETMSFGVHRYAVAIENIVDKKILPAQLVSHVFGMIATWWAEQDDMDTFTTLFRDYPHFVSEVQNLTSTEITERVYPLFGRGTYNNVNALPQYIYAGDGTKGDIEPGTAVTGFKSIANGDKKGLATTDTLTDTFIQALGDYLEQQLATMPIAMDGGAPFYGMILDTADVKNIFKNSSSTLIANIKAMVRNSDGGSDIFNKNPIFQRQLEHLYNIRMFKWGPIAPLFGSSGDIAENKKDGTPQKGQLSTSIKKGLRGTAITPQAKVLAAAKGAEAVTGLSTWAGGDIKTSVWTQRGVGSTATNYFLFLSCGATHFPYFDGGAVYGADSYNHVDAGYINVTSAALGAGGADGATYGAAPDGSGYYGRAQIGSGATATTQWKIVYKGPLYVGTIQVGNNNEQFTFADDAYMLQIIGLHRWNAGTSAFDAANTRDADWATFKAFLGINASTKVIDQAAAFQTRTFQYNRRVHMFDTVRTLVYGKDLIYKVVGGGAEYNEETRDYGAITGRALTVVQGKKVVVDAQGLISNYIVVCFKRPMVTL